MEAYVIHYILGQPLNSGKMKKRKIHYGTTNKHYDVSYRSDHSGEYGEKLGKQSFRRISSGKVKTDSRAHHSDITAAVCRKH